MYRVSSLLVAMGVVALTACGSDGSSAEKAQPTSSVTAAESTAPATTPPTTPPTTAVVTVPAETVPPTTAAPDPANDGVLDDAEWAELALSLAADPVASFISDPTKAELDALGAGTCNFLVGGLRLDDAEATTRLELQKLDARPEYEEATIQQMRMVVPYICAERAAE